MVTLLISKQHTGFTLLEMIIVLAITGLLMAIVAPKLPGVLANTQMKTATREIAAGLKNARIKAISSRQEQALLFDTQNKSYALGDRQKQLGIPDGSELSLVTAESEQVSETQGKIRFFTDGSSTGGQVKLQYKHNAYVVDVNWRTGKVSIFP